MNDYNRAYFVSQACIDLGELLQQLAALDALAPGDATLLAEVIERTRSRFRLNPLNEHPENGLSSGQPDR